MDPAGDNQRRRRRPLQAGWSTPRQRGPSKASAQTERVLETLELAEPPQDPTCEPRALGLASTAEPAASNRVT